MKIAVLAADGRTGLQFVQRARAAGHEIRAGVYRDTHIFDSDSHVETVSCDATILSNVERLINGCDAVVSLIGHVKGSSKNVQTIAIENVISAMKSYGIKRLVSLTGTGVRFPGDVIPLYDWPLNLAIRIIDPKRVQDGISHVRSLQKVSTLDWTVVRVLKLTNGAPKSFVLSVDKPTKLFTSRAEVALGILQILEEQSFVRQAPVLSRSMKNN